MNHSPLDISPRELYKWSSQLILYCLNGKEHISHPWGLKTHNEGDVEIKSDKEGGF